MSPLGIAQIAVRLPNFTNLTVLKCHNASWQALTPTLTKVNAYLNFNFHCTSAPNYPGKGSDPQKQAHLNVDILQITNTKMKYMRPIVELADANDIKISSRSKLCESASSALTC